MIRNVLNGPVDNAALNQLFDAAWPTHTSTDFDALTAESLFHLVTLDAETVIGFVRVVACGGSRGFLLGPTVHPDWHGQGIGKTLLDVAAAAAEDLGLESLHVEFAPSLRRFYASADFRHTAAGVRRLSPSDSP